MAKHENYDKSFARFILKNEELIDEYEDHFGESLYDIKYDILAECKAINNIIKTPSYQLLVDSTRRAIDADTDILAVLENIKSTASINPDSSHIFAFKAFSSSIASNSVNTNSFINS